MIFIKYPKESSFSIQRRRKIEAERLVCTLEFANKPFDRNEQDH